MIKGDLTTEAIAAIGGRWQQCGGQREGNSEKYTRGTLGNPSPKLIPILELYCFSHMQNLHIEISQW